MESISRSRMVGLESCILSLFNLVPLPAPWAVSYSLDIEYPRRQPALYSVDFDVKELTYRGRWNLGHSVILITVIDSNCCPQITGFEHKAFCTDETLSDEVCSM